jgi:hypothetical protein
MFHLERVEKDKDGQRRKYSCTGSIYYVAALTRTIVAIHSEIAVTDSVNNDDEAHEWSDTHDNSVHNDIGGEFFGEHTGDDVVGWTKHDVVGSWFQTQSHIRTIEE